MTPEQREQIIETAARSILGHRQRQVNVWDVMKESTRRYYRTAIRSTALVEVCEALEKAVDWCEYCPPHHAKPRGMRMMEVGRKDGAPVFEAKRCPYCADARKALALARGEKE